MEYSMLFQTVAKNVIASVAFYAGLQFSGAPEYKEKITFEIQKHGLRNKFEQFVEDYQKEPLLITAYKTKYCFGIPVIKKNIADAFFVNKPSLFLNCNQSNKTWTLEEIIVKDSEQRQGTGSTIIRIFESHYQPKRLELASVPTAVNFYRKQGFKKDPLDKSKKPGGLMFKDYPTG
jgi:hypothetical protein